jgi:hypothetical protein
VIKAAVLKVCLYPVPRHQRDYVWLSPGARANFGSKDSRSTPLLPNTGPAPVALPFFLFTLPSNSLHFIRDLLQADLILIKPLVFRQPNNHANRPLVTLDVYLTANHFFTSLQDSSSLLKVNSEYFFIQISLLMTSFSENVAGLAWAVVGGCICGRPCRYAPL